MQAMGWPMKVGHGPDSIVIFPPADQSPVTISLRTNRGDSKRNTMTAIKRTGYYEAWEQHETLRRTVTRIDDKITTEVNEVLGQVAQLVNEALDELATEQAHDITAALATETTPTEDNTMPEIPTQHTPATIAVTAKPITDRYQVLGVPITSRGPAKDTFGGELREVAGVDEITLADGRVMHQCVRSVRCFWVADTARSVISHLRTHGSATATRKADQKHANYSAGAKAGHEARMARLAELKDLGPTQALAELGAILGDAAQVARDLAKLTAEPVVSETDMAAAQALMDEQVAELERLRAELERRPDISREDFARIVAKADRWDAWRAALSEE